MLCHQCSRPVVSQKYVIWLVVPSSCRISPFLGLLQQAPRTHSSEGASPLSARTAEEPLQRGSLEIRADGRGQEGEDIATKLGLLGLAIKILDVELNLNYRQALDTFLV